MNPVKNAITSLVTKITSIPANLRGAAKEQIANSVELGAEIAGVQLAEIVSEMIKETLEGEGFDATITVNIKLKKN